MFIRKNYDCIMHIIGVTAISTFHGGYLAFLGSHILSFLLERLHNCSIVILDPKNLCLYVKNYDCIMHTIEVTVISTFHGGHLEFLLKMTSESQFTHCYQLNSCSGGSKGCKKCGLVELSGEGGGCTRAIFGSWPIWIH